MPSKPFAARVDELRDKIAARRTELDQLPEASIPAPDAIARMTAWVDSQAAAFTIGANAFTGEQFSRPTTLLLTAIRNGNHMADVDTGPLLCWLLGDVIKTKLTAAIKALPHAPGIPLAERPAAVQRLRDEIARLETAEERLIREAEAAGEPVIRRGDARPEIVLAVNP